MEMLLGLLLMVAGIAQFVCFIIVVIKLFQNEGPLYGILGIICGIYTLVWGWMNADKLNIRKIVLAWTILIAVQLVLYFLVMMVAGSRMS